MCITMTQYHYSIYTVIIRNLSNKSTKMANYKHNKQGKLTEMYAGEPKTRVNMSLTAKALAGLDEMIASGLGDSRSDVVEKLGRGELLPYTHKIEKETPLPNTHKVNELLLEAQKVKASKKKGSVSRLGN